MHGLQKFQFLVLLSLALSGCSQHSPYKPDPNMVAKSATEKSERPLDAQRLLGGVWHWQGSGNPNSAPQSGSNSQNYSLRFLDTGLMEVKMDCYQAQGVYAADRGNLQVAFGPTTFPECNSDSLSAFFLQQLTGATGYYFRGERLILESATSGGTLELLLGS